MQYFHHVIPYLQDLGSAGYLLIFTVSFFESLVFTGMFVPGTVFVVIAGGLAAHGFYSFWLLTIVSSAAAISGDAISYELGRRGKMHLERWDFLKKHIQKAQPFFKRHQKKSILLGRFIGPTRPVIPFVAGIADMERRYYYPMNVASGFLWSLFYVTLGYIFGTAWKQALAWSSGAVLLIVLVIALWSFVRWMLSKQ